MGGERAALEREVAALELEGTGAPKPDPARKDLGLTARQVTSYDWAFQKPRGEQFKEVVRWTAAQVDMNPGLVAVNFIAEASRDTYLSKGKVSSFVVGTDDYHDKRSDIAGKVPAHARVGWDRRTGAFFDTNETGRRVRSILFSSGRDAALASAVYLKHGEVVLREHARSAGGNFDSLPLETRFMLVRVAFNMGHGAARAELGKALKGQDVLIRKPARKAGPRRIATLRAAQAVHTSEQIFGLPGSSPQAPPAAPEREVIQPDERKQVPDTLAMPFRWICSIAITYQDPGQRYEERTRMGSGVLVGDRHVLTAAHVLMPGDGRAPAREVMVYPARHGSRASAAPFGGVKAKSWKVSPHWRRNGRSNLSFDYALITLESALATRTHQTLSGPLVYWGHQDVRAQAQFARLDPAYLQGRRICVAGYPGDKPAGTMWMALGVLQDVRAAARLMRHTGDTEEGQSGSPVWIRVDGQRCLVGIHVAPERRFADGRQVPAQANVAVRVTRELLRQVQAWIAG